MTFEINGILSELLALPVEIEWVEFKAARGEFDLDQLGRYFSALSNEANLNDKPFGWLVFGITNEYPRQVCGTHYKDSQESINKLKHALAQETNHQLTFHAIHETTRDGQRVLIFQVPAAMNGVPTEWRGRTYGRHGESVSPLSLSEIDRIRSPFREDWSIQICEQAILDHLDPAAIRFARIQYKEKNPKLSDDVDSWDDMIFLNKAKICLEGRITRTALILLGKPESSSFLSPVMAQITWVLKNEKGIEKDYAHFGLPFILTVNDVFAKIRNLTYRYLPNATLFPTEVKQYDEWVIREILHNCIAHQDYRLGGRINLVEEPDSLLFTNSGRFIPGSVEEVIKRDAPPQSYRNPFLAQAMVNVKMIDTIGSGIKRMFAIQRSRFFPLPDFDLNEPNCVKVQLTGKILDERYTRMLIEKADLDLDAVIMLDRVQKKKPITKEQHRFLKENNLVEGRWPKLFVSAKIAAILGDRVAYIRNRALDKTQYKRMILEYLTKYGKTSRADLDVLLNKYLSDTLDLKQKNRFISNLLQEMRKENLIVPEGATRWSRWSVSKRSSEGHI